MSNLQSPNVQPPPLPPTLSSHPDANPPLTRRQLAKVAFRQKGMWVSLVMFMLWIVFSQIVDSRVAVILIAPILLSFMCAGLFAAALGGLVYPPNGRLLGVVMVVLPITATVIPFVLNARANNVFRQYGLAPGLFGASRKRIAASGELQ